MRIEAAIIGSTAFFDPPIFTVHSRGFQPVILYIFFEN
jgi:hypothetical protein